MQLDKFIQQADSGFIGTVNKFVPVKIKVAFWSDYICKEYNIHSLPNTQILDSNGSVVTTIAFDSYGGDLNKLRKQLEKIAGEK